MKKRMSVLAGLLILILAVSSVTGCGGQEEKDQENQIIAKETGQEKEEAEKSEVKEKEEGPEEEPEEKAHPSEAAGSGPPQNPAAAENSPSRKKNCRFGPQYWSGSGTGYGPHSHPENGGHGRPG